MSIILSGDGSITGLTSTGISAAQTVTSANMPVGSVLQVVNVVYGTEIGNNTTTYADSNLTATITPKFSTSKILVSVSGSMFVFTNAQANITVYRNGSNIGNSSGFNTVYAASANAQAPANFVYLDSPASTSTQTYLVYFLNSNNSASIVFNSGGNGNNEIATIILMEIAQ